MSWVGYLLTEGKMFRDSAELKLDVPGKYMMVDHALSRVERGLSGVMQAEGQQRNASLYKDYDPARSAMVMGH